MRYLSLLNPEALPPAGGRELRGSKRTVPRPYLLLRSPLYLPYNHVSVCLFEAFSHMPL